MTTVDEILQRRAETLANRQKNEKAREEQVSITVFVAGPEQLAVPTASLACIVKTPSVAVLPHLPPWFKGMAQVRGEIVGVVDPAIWFGVPGESEGGFMAVVEGSPGKLGLLVDKVLGFRDIGVSDLAVGFGEGSTVWSRPIRGATKDLTAILDMDKLFASPDIRIGFNSTDPEGTQDSPPLSELQERSK